MSVLMGGQGRIDSQLGEGMTDTETSRGAWEACFHGQNLVDVFSRRLHNCTPNASIFCLGPSGLWNFGISH